MQKQWRIIIQALAGLSILSLSGEIYAQNIPNETKVEHIGELYVQTEVLRKKELFFWGTRQKLRQDFAQTLSAKQKVKNIFNHAHKKTTKRYWHSSKSVRLAMVEQDGAALFAQPESPIKESKYDIPILYAPMVKQYIDYFTGRGRSIFRTWLKRYDRYGPMMRPILKSYGVPQDLVFIAMIESAFNAKAYSISAAGGFWQFIPSTARHFDLKMTTWLDERRDFVKSTQKAAQYLKQLKKKFGDWHLAWAAYNAGEGRIRRALRRHGVETYWELSAVRKAIAKETVHYVPRVIASAILAKNREKYGFTNIPSLKPLYYDVVTVDGALDLRHLAKHFAIRINTLRGLNPALRHDITPPNRSWKLRVPKGSGTKVAKWLKVTPEAQKFTYIKYKVRSGDSLWKIAKSFKTTISVIKDFNRINNVKTLRLGQTLLIPKLRGNEKIAYSAPKTKTTKKKRSSSAPKRSGAAQYTVRKGDTLWQIASRHGTTVAQIKRLNNKTSDNLDIGERLVIRASASKKKSTQVTQITVKPGDTLWRIARRHSVTITQLKNWNKIKDADRLSVGQVLKVRP